MNLLKSVLTDKSISLTAKGMYVYLLQFRDMPEYVTIIHDLGINKTKAIALLRELKTKKVELPYQYKIVPTKIDGMTEAKKLFTEIYSKHDDTGFYYTAAEIKHMEQLMRKMAFKIQTKQNIEIATDRMILDGLRIFFEFTRVMLGDPAINTYNRPFSPMELNTRFTYYFGMVKAAKTSSTGKAGIVLNAVQRSIQTIQNR